MSNKSISTTACLHSQESYPQSNKICGLYPLERLVKALYAAGIRTFFFDLCRDEADFFQNKILKRIDKLENIEIILDNCTKTTTPFFRIPTNLFTQQHYFNDFDTYFVDQNNIIVPVIKDDQYTIKTREDIKKSNKLLKQWILDNTGGWFARNINKRVSLPMSTVIASTRINPNILTVFNFLLAILSALLVFKNEYWSIAAGGLLIQFVSIFDGVDGEVAKFTFSVSKFGGWLDTICDYTATLMFLIASSYLFYLHFQGITALFFLGILALGVLNYYIIVKMYLKRFETTGSLRGYETEFLRKLPEDDKLVNFILSLHIISKREFYILIFCLVCLTGKIYYIIPIIASLLFIATLLLLAINFKYLPQFSPEK